MTSQHTINSQPIDSSVYEIRVGGHLDPQWTLYFDDAEMRLLEDGTTLLTCLVADQAALHAMLRKVRDLGLTLLVVNRLPAKWD